MMGQRLLGIILSIGPTLAQRLLGPILRWAKVEPMLSQRGSATFFIFPLLAQLWPKVT